MDKHFYY